MTHDGRYVPVEIKPTVDKNTTEYNAEGAWVDSQNIRFKDGRPQSIGGHTQYNLNRTVVGVARDIHSFVELDTKKHWAVGTHKKLMLEETGSLYDITPVDTSTSVSNCISTSSGSPIVRVNIVAHGRNIGDYVIFTSVQNVSVGGITLHSNQYEIVSVSGTDEFYVSASSNATATSVSSGGTVRFDFLLPTGYQSNQAAQGWGSGTWGTSGAATSAGWGDPRAASGLTNDLRMWSLDNWGEDLLACPRNGGVYWWDADTSASARAVRITQAPSQNGLIKVAYPRRQLVLYGTMPEGTSAYDPLYIRWCDREDFTDWNASANNRAGGIRLTKGNEIVGVIPTKQENLILTDSAVFVQRPLDSDLVFGFDLVAADAGMISQNAGVDIDGISFWMGTRAFYTYNGVVSELPCTVDDFVFSRVDLDQKEKTFCATNKDFSEIIWLYQSTSASVGGDIDSYVKYNYSEGAWDTGTIDRVVWEDAIVFEKPIAINASGVAYNHESGTDADGSGLKSYIESSYFDIEDGTKLLLVDQIVPDLVQSGLINFTIYTRKYPNGTETVKGPYQLTNATEWRSFRAKGRQAKIRFSTSAVGSAWEIGKIRFRVKEDGER